MIIFNYIDNWKITGIKEQYEYEYSVTTGGKEQKYFN